MNNTMKFENGRFQILIVSDFHAPASIPSEMKNFVRKTIEQTKPQLVVFLGDNTAGNFVGANSFTIKRSIDELVGLVEGIPFAVVLGNHDHEGLCNAQNFVDETQAKQKIFSFFKDHHNCIGEENIIDGRVGNYNILLRDSKDEKDIFCLRFLDSGSQVKGEGYCRVTDGQNQWHRECSQALSQEKGGKMPTMIFQHIIVPEIYECFEERNTYAHGFTKGQCGYSDKYYRFKQEHLISGSIKEGPCPPDINGGQFDSWLETGDVLAAFFGHDHVNDFVCDYKGIKLINVPSPSTYTYGNNRGVRAVTLYEDDIEGFSTQVLYYNDVSDDRIRNPIVRSFGLERYQYKFLPAVRLTAGVTAFGLWRAAVHYAKKNK